MEKPAGLLSVPGREGPLQDCLINRVKIDYPTAQICHRLDMDTSGLMIIPLKKAAQSAFGRLFETKQIHKRYIADVWGHPSQQEDSIDAPLRGIPDAPPRQQICHEHGKPSLTHFQVLKSKLSANNTPIARLALTPVTGRTHQLRIHLASIGHPILGCDLYAHEAAYRATNRLHLHAATLEFPDPTTHQMQHIASTQLPFE